MLFLPCFVFVAISAVFHLALFFIVWWMDILATDKHREAIMLTEGLLDDFVQFYMYFMAPIQIARRYRMT